MDVTELASGLFFLRFPVGHAYLSVDRDGLTLIDTSLPGSGPRLAALDTEIVCAGHADPITQDAAVFLRAAAGPLG